MLGLGRYAEVDERSALYDMAPALVAQQVQLRTRIWMRRGGTLNQGSSAACVGFAMAHALNTTPLWHKGLPLLDQDDAILLYNEAILVSEANEEDGASGLAVAKAAKKLGFITGYRHALSFGEVLGSIMLTPVICGLDWTESMLTPDDQSFVHPSGDAVGGYEFCIYGANIRYNYFNCIGSWGPRWGKNGAFKLSFADFVDLFERGGDVIVPIASVSRAGVQE
jgi:hypothetical protein